MHYGIKTFSLLFSAALLASCARLPMGTGKKGKMSTIAFYNTEKLFDTTNNPAAADDDFVPAGPMQWTAEKYTKKIAHIASAIKGVGGADGPAVVGLAEVENKNVLQDLISSPVLSKAKYSIVHHEMPNDQGLGIALLYKPKAFKLLSERVLEVSYGNGFKGRGILEVSGELQGVPVTIFVNHWPARTRTRRGLRDDSRLRTAAAALRKRIDVLQAADAQANIIVLGDFDAEPPSDVMLDVLKANGRPNPYYKNELFNTFYLLYVSGMGSYYSRGEFKMLDQILISKTLLDDEGLEYVRGSAHVYDPEELKFLYGKYKNTPLSTFSGKTYFGGYSDHFPIYIQVRKEKKAKKN